MTTAIISLFRNEPAAELATRIDHLLAKAGTNRWIWATGDASPDTYRLLKHRAALEKKSNKLDIEVIKASSGIVGDDVLSSRARTAFTASAAFASIRDTDTLVLLHESDLLSPIDVIAQLLASGHLPIAGWPTIELTPNSPQFYDIWAYRDLGGRHFAATQVRPRRPLRVSSFGSLWLAPAALVRNRVLGPDAIVGLCREWTSEGVRLWVDPRVPVIQPVDRWEAR